MAGYQSIFSNKGSGSNPFADDFKPGQYLPKNQPQNNNSNNNSNNQPKNTPAPKQSLFSKVKSVAKNVANAATTGEQKFATGIARTLPGGTADLQAENQAADQNSKDLQFIKNQVKAGKMPQATADKLIKQNAASANQTSKETNDIVKKMPTKKDIALGAASTAADILTAGSLPELKAAKGTSLTSKVIKGGTEAAGYGTAGALNSAAGGGDKKQIAENFIAGAALPGALHITGKALGSIMSKVRPTRSMVEAGKAEAEASKVAAADAEKNSIQVQKNIETGQKLDNQIELLNAKKADGKFTNVDQVKVKQLQDQKKALNLPEEKQPTVNKTPQSVDNAPANVNKTEGSMPKTAETTSTKTTGEVPASEMNINGKVGPFYRVDQMDEGVRSGLHGEKFNQDAKNGTVTVYRAGKPNEKLSDGTFLTADKETAKSYLNNKSTKAGEFGGPKLYSYKIPAKDLVSVDNMDFSELVYKSKPQDINEIKTEINKLRNDDNSYDSKGNFKPEITKQINQLHKQLNAAGKRIPAAEKPVTNIPIEQVKKGESPIPEIRTTKLSQGVEANAIKKGIADGFEGKSEYAKVNIDQQAKAAADLLKNDPTSALRIAMGLDRPPEGLLPESVFIAVEKAATKAGDADLLRRLATESHLTSEASGMGQRIRMLGERETSSPVAAIKKVADARAAAFEKKTGKTVSQAVDEEIKKIKAASAGQPVTKETWSTFVDSLKC